MRPNLEIEKKLELSQDGYRRLLQQATVESKVEQLNVYFDEDWVLAENAATVRVRFASGQPPMLTFKVPLSNSNGIRTAHEYEFRIEREFARRCRVTRRAIEVGDGWPTEVREAASRLGLSRLRRVGWVRNTRFVLTLGGRHFELDCLKLPNGETIFEVEVEDSDVENVRRTVDSILETVPEARPSTRSKFQRFRAAAAESRAQARVSGCGN